MTVQLCSRPMLSLRFDSSLRVRESAMGAWLTALEMRVPRNVLMVAMAKKLRADRMGGTLNGQDYWPFQIR